MQHSFSRRRLLGGMAALRRMLPFQQILFGSDFPFSNMAEDRKLLPVCGVFTPQELDALAYDNVVGILPKYA